MAETKGILGTKLGMTQIFEDTRAVPVTVIKAGPSVVSQVKTKETDGYDAVQLSFGTVRPRDLTRPMKGHFESHDAKPGRHVVELRTDDAGSYEPGQEITVDVFQPGRPGRRGRRLEGPRHDRRDEAPRVPRTPRQPRHEAQAPRARGDRRVRDPEPGVQGHADGRAAREHARDGAEPRGRPGRRRARAAPGQGRGPGPERRAPDGAVRGQGAHPWAVEGGTPDGLDRDARRRREEGGFRGPARRDLRVDGERAADAPGGRGRPRRHPCGDPLDEDARPGPRRREEAVAAEGHRPRPPGIDPVAAVGRRRRRPRPDTRATTRRRSTRRCGGERSAPR